MDAAVTSPAVPRDVAARRMDSDAQYSANAKGRMNATTKHIDGILPYPHKSNLHLYYAPDQSSCHHSYRALSDVTLSLAINCKLKHKLYYNHMI